MNHNDPSKRRRNTLRTHNSRSGIHKWEEYHNHKGSLQGARLLSPPQALPPRAPAPGLCSGEPPREAGGKPNSPWGGDAGSSHWGHPFYQGNTALASDTSDSSPSLLVVEAYPPTSRRAPGPRPGRQQWEAYLTLQQACTHHMWQASHPGWGPVPPTSAPITEAPP